MQVRTISAEPIYDAWHSVPVPPGPRCHVGDPEAASDTTTLTLSEALTHRHFAGVIDSQLPSCQGFWGKT